MRGQITHKTETLPWFLGQMPAGGADAWWGWFLLGALVVIVSLVWWWRYGRACEMEERWREVILPLCLILLGGAMLFPPAWSWLDVKLSEIHGVLFGVLLPEVRVAPELRSSAAQDIRWLWSCPLA